MNNPYFFNPIMGYGINRNINPIYYPRMNRSFLSNVASFRPTQTLSLTKIISNTQRGINTINQIIPIYKQIKPIYTQAKTWSSSIKSFLNSPRQSTQKTTFNANPMKNNQNLDNDFSQFFRQQKEPNNPFFY